jgi:hypothetical protein
MNDPDVAIRCPYCYSRYVETWELPDGWLLNCESKSRCVACGHTWLNERQIEFRVGDRVSHPDYPVVLHVIEVGIDGVVARSDDGTIVDGLYKDFRKCP